MATALRATSRSNKARGTQQNETEHIHPARWSAHGALAATSKDPSTDALYAGGCVYIRKEGRPSQTARQSGGKYTREWSNKYYRDIYPAVNEIRKNVKNKNAEKSLHLFK